MLHQCTINDFEKALSILDKKLTRENLRIEIKAIGGFAMMYYGIRVNGYTMDIDTLTNEYSSKVLELIHEVGKEAAIDRDWLNNDCAGLEGFMSILGNEIKWLPSKYEFQMIDLCVADIKGLIRSKAKAIHDGGLVPRSTDKKDILDALAYVGIGNIEELNANQEYSFISEEYQRCYEFLKKQDSWR